MRDVLIFQAGTNAVLWLNRDFLCHACVSSNNDQHNGQKKEICKTVCLMENAFSQRKQNNIFCRERYLRRSDMVFLHFEYIAYSDCLLKWRLFWSSSSFLFGATLFKAIISTQTMRCVWWQWLETHKKRGLVLTEAPETCGLTMYVNANLCSPTQEHLSRILSTFRVRLWKYDFSLGNKHVCAHSVVSTFFALSILISCVAAFIVFAKHHHAQCTHDQINASAYEMETLKTHDRNNKMMQLTLNKHVKEMILWSGVCVCVFFYSSDYNRWCHYRTVVTSHSHHSPQCSSVFLWHV